MPSATSGPQPAPFVYDDNLINGWMDWSTGTSVILQDPTYVHLGLYSCSAAYIQAWGELHFANAGFRTVGYDNLVFYVNGGSASGQRLTINLVNAAGRYLQSLDLNQYIAGGSIQANTWRRAVVPLRALKAAKSTITGIVLKDALGHSQPRFYIDDMQFVNGTPVSGPLGGVPGTTADPGSGSGLLDAPLGMWAGKDAGEGVSLAPGLALVRTLTE